MSRGGARPGAGRPPGSRNKITLEDGRTLGELAREQTEFALDVLVSVASDTEAPPSARVTAATAILDRGWGKPPQGHELADAPEVDYTKPPSARIIRPGDEEFEAIELDD